MLEVACKVGSGKQQVQRLGFGLLLQPLQRLALAQFFQIAAVGEGGFEVKNCEPDGFDAALLQRATAQNARLPRGVLAAQNMQGGFIHMTGDCHPGAVLAIIFIDNHDIRHLHNPLLNALQIVTAAGDLQRDKAVHQPGEFRFRLADADGFDNHRVIARRFAQQYQLPRAQAGAAQMAAGGHRANKGRIRSRQFDHARLVAKNAAAADRAARIDRYHRDPQAVANQQHAESFQKSAFSGPRRAGDAEAQGVAGEGHNGIQQLCA
ncbi:Uncharacterised protein [Klebsiella pneumoniae]|nr:Uncharacterised protein [Klebsiella pneumoniae]